MTFFKAERDIQFRQIRERLFELSQRIYRDAVPIGGWLALQTGRGQGPQPIPSSTGSGKSAWKPFETGPGAGLTQAGSAALIAPISAIAQSSIPPKSTNEARSPFTSRCATPQTATPVSIGCRSQDRARPLELPMPSRITAPSISKLLRWIPQAGGV